jgi:hypothetical protein
MVHLNTVQNKNLYRAKLFLKENTGRILLSILALIMFMTYRRIFIFGIFIALDIISTYLDRNFLISFPVDFLLAAMIIASYSISVYYGLVLSLFVIINRLAFGTMEVRHLSKMPVLFIICVASSLLTWLPIQVVGPIMIGLRYTLEYGISFVTTGQFPSERIIKRILNLLGGTMFFCVLGAFLVSVLA